MLNHSEIEEDQLPSYKIIILGRTSVGKTKLLMRYKFGTYSDEGSITIGVDSHIVLTKTAKFTYYDTAGQDKFKSIINSYYRGSDACIITYDVTSMQSFQQIAYYHNTAKQLIPDILIYIVGCKSDQPRQVKQEAIKSAYPGYTHECTSAKNNTNVKEMFNRLEQELVLKKQKTVERVRRPVLSEKPAKKQLCCGKG